MTGDDQVSLDAPTQSLLSQMSSSDSPPLYELSVGDARAALKELTLSLDAPECSVGRREERVIPGPEGNISLRIYWPELAPQAPNPPVLLLFHGGGFALGDLDTHENVSRLYCHEAGVIVVSVAYRLAPEHSFPAAVTDCYAALRWVAETAGEWGGDPERIAVTGDSAGGNLAAVVCLAARDRGGPRIKFQALVYPVVSMDPDTSFPSRKQFGGGEFFLSTNDFIWLNSMYFSHSGQAHDPMASPLLAESLAHLPPALVITAGYDPLRDEGKAYSERLVAAGVVSEYRCFETTVHGFMSFSGLIDAGREGLQLVARRIREVFAGET